MKLLAALFAFCLFTGAHAAPLPATVTEELKKAHIPQSAIAIEIREIGKGRRLISINAQRMMNPASTMKLLTTYAALDILDSSCTWKTEVYV